MQKYIDFIFALIVLLIFSPFILLIVIVIRLESKGNVFYVQERVGQSGKPFRLFKFRTMSINSDKQGLLTVGMKDNRITKSGYYLRKYKLDEIPQFFNVLKGDMSIVGPRPEVQKYVNYYTQEQQLILQLKPGITDYASIEFVKENEILEKAENPEKTYIEEIMPRKIELNKKYLQDPSVLNYFRIIFLTILSIFNK
jgi:lipopolysaccharide/colanic/teichoic acid biosynthesis glycosyltransferase